MSEDSDTWAWKRFPNLRHWFNKLDLALKLGYKCGPCGTAPDQPLEVVIRPIYNLYGMSAGVTYTKMTPGCVDLVPPGYFWCERFHGNHFSVTYHIIPQGEAVPVSCYRAIPRPEEPEFEMWVNWNSVPLETWRLNHPIFEELWNHDGSGPLIINVEWINGNVIEVHLRKSPDPDGLVIYPIFENDRHSDRINIATFADNTHLKWVSAYDNAGGHINNPRIGFYVGEK